MPYSCPDCGESLTGSVRELEFELEDGETVQLLDGNRVVVTTAVCSNGCSADPDEKPRRKKRTSHAHDAACEKTADCDRPSGHTGRCNHKRELEGAEA